MTDKAKLDIEECRGARPYSPREYMLRVLWALAGPLFRWSPRPFFGWRRFLLRLFGAKVGRDAHVYPSTVIYLPWNLTLGDQAAVGEWVLVYNLGPVVIGAQATISHRAHLCAGTHDYSDPNLPLIRSGITIGAQAWVCADAFVGPGREVGEGAIVGAGSVVIRDVPPWTIAAGNPARSIGARVLAMTNAVEITNES